jgi:hypothetical protein
MLREDYIVDGANRMLANLCRLARERAAHLIGRHRGRVLRVHQSVRKAESMFSVSLIYVTVRTVLCNGGAA